MPCECESTLLRLAGDIQRQTTSLVQQLYRQGIADPSLQVGAQTQLWTHTPPEIAKTKGHIVGLMQDLSKLLLGPRGFLHDFVSPNWDLGALYTILEFDILDQIPLDGEAAISELALRSGIPEDKLLHILRLAVCDQILEEPSEDSFKHTAISEALVTDDKFKAFIGFQLFETRVASAHLADSLKLKANDYRTGQSAFKYAWGSLLYEWYKTHPEKSARFDKAMEGVAHSLDPGNALFCNWMRGNRHLNEDLVIDVGGGNGHVATFLAREFDELKFLVQDGSKTLLAQGKGNLSPTLEERIRFEQCNFFDARPAAEAGVVLAYVLRNVLWNWSDEDAVRILQTFIPIMQKSPQTAILVNDGISPVYRSVSSHHEEKPYRRRDVTVMTMHNTKQRTEQQWAELFEKVNPDFRVKLSTAYSPHSFRGLWELRLGETPLPNGHH